MVARSSAGCLSSTVRRVVLGGEEAAPSDVALLEEHFAPGCVLMNGFGPTESTLALQHVCDPQRDGGWLRLPIGVPVEGTRIVLLDRSGGPTDLVGEIAISSPNLALGYFRRPGLTAARFVPCPFGTGGRLYRTGDLARRRPNGELEYLGRIDRQVKQRGYRIELGEIEAVLRLQPDVRDAVVIQNADGTGDKRLAAYVAGEVDLDGENLRRRLGERLPDYMVPSAFVVLTALPLTPNGKVDHAALPEPGWSELRAASVAPRTPTEVVLAGIWCEVLGRDNVGVEDSFLDLGGHSLLAMRVVVRARERCGIELPFRTIFEAPTIALLAARIDAILGENVGTAPPPLRPRPPGCTAPASFAQERLWFLEELEKLGSAYHISIAARLQGDIDISALSGAFDQLVRRHEILRTRFETVDGAPVQIVETARPFELPVHDLTGVSEDARDVTIRGHIRSTVNLPFDLRRAPLLRAALLRTSPRDHVIVVVLHHLAADGWSREILIREIASHYHERVSRAPAASPELAVQYGDYALWQRQWLQGEALRRQLDYWRAHLESAPPVLDLPLDRQRPARQSFRGAVVPLALSRTLSEALGAFARLEGVTLFPLLLAAFDVVLSRWSGQQDIVVGTPIAGRVSSVTEPLIGMFANTLALRVDLSGDPTVRGLLQRVRDVTLGAFAHADLPFEKLVEELKPHRDLDRQPIFQVLLALQNVPQGKVDLPGLRLSRIDVEHVAAKHDLSLYLHETTQGLRGRLEYATDLFDAATAERLVGHFSRVLEQMIAHPDRLVSELDMLAEAERERMLNQWNRPPQPNPAESCIHQLFVEQAARTPEAVALMHGPVRLSYRELDRRSNQLAHHLRGMGAGPDVVVGLLAERSIEMVVGLLGILKAGAAYLPLDPSYPPDRLSFMIADAGVGVVLTHGELNPPRPEMLAIVRVDADWGHIARQPASPPDSCASPDNMAYVIYTSGSTGRPKGVMIRHAAVVNLLASMQQQLSFGGTDVLLAVTRLSFDMSVPEFYLPLVVGGAVALLDREVVSSGERLQQSMQEVGATVMQATPASWRLLLDAGWRPDGKLRIWCGGEALPPHLAELLTQHSEVWNLYGPTETTVWSTANRLRHGDAPVIGRPLANTQIYLLGPDMQLVPIGATGEIHIGGVGLARGYLGRASLTAERFVPSPFASGQRLYRTGDLARWTVSGMLEYVGRGDHQVKLRGFRIELGEIEAALREQAGIEQAIAIVREDSPGEKRLVAYLLGPTDTSIDSSELRDDLKRVLPAYMVPSAFVRLSAWPLTANGKVDRRALPAPDMQPRDTESVPPRTPTEKLLAAIWCEVLGITQLGIHDNFFDLGGHSLLAMRVIARARERHRADVSLRMLFEAPTIAGFAARVDDAGRNHLRESLPMPVPRDRSVPAPASFGQERLWFLERLEALGSTYHMTAAIRLRGTLRLDALQAAFDEVQRRHEVLRSRFSFSDGRLVQIVDPPGRFPLTLHDLVARGDERDGALRQGIREAARAAFALETGPLFRAVVFRMGETDHVVVMSMHHIVSDGWSRSILAREISTLYRSFVLGQSSPLKELALQYADYAAWQRGWMQGAMLDRHLCYWKEHLRGAPEALDLPADRARPPEQSFRGGTIVFALGTELSKALSELGRREGATLFMVLMAAFKIVLSRWSGQADIVVGTPVAGRSHSMAEALVGLFANTLALRTDMRGDPTFVDLLARVRSAALGAYMHQDLPFEKLVEELRPARDLSRQPIFQALLALQNVPPSLLTLPGLEASLVGGDATSAKFDLSLYFFETENGLRCTTEYAADLFDKSTIERFIGHLRTLLAGIVADPGRRMSDLPMLTRAERELLVETWNKTAAPYEDGATLHGLFAVQAAKTPLDTAVTFDGKCLTYAELDRQSSQLAQYLRGMGVDLDTCVGLCLERSIGMVVALVGILKAGAAYLPLDPSYPPDRLAHLVKDTAASVLVTDSALDHICAALPARLVRLDADREAIASMPTVMPDTQAGSDNLCYVIYTSGSTGKPKGVMIRHGAVINLISAMRETLGFTPEDTLFAVTRLSFDMSVPEFYLPLLTGGTVALQSRATASDGVRLRHAISELRPTVLQATPASWRMLLENGWEPDGATRIWCGGEALTRDLAKALAVQGTDVRNLYGPTETTVWSSSARVTEGGRLSVGRPLANTEIHILDHGCDTVAVGITGEICIGGAGLARGYLGQAGLTAERFIPNPFKPGERLYRTGDMGRRLSDGQIECLGRRDYQVKVRGYRIELGEIESVLATHESVEQVAVLARESRPGDQRLVCYVVGRNEAPDIATLRAHLQRSLPDYMIPSTFISLERLPLTANGKIDRSALVAVAFGQPADQPVAPRTQTECRLAAVWSEVLGLDQIGLNDKFFDIGGHSLLASRLTARIYDEFGIDFPLRLIFGGATVATMADFIDDETPPRPAPATSETALQ